MFRIVGKLFENAADPKVAGPRVQSFIKRYTVQYPLPTGNVREQSFLDIWRHSPALADVRSIRVGDLSTCSQCSHVGSCSRCPGLAYMEGSMRGPSTLDCAKSFARTGVPSAGMLAAAQRETGQTLPAGVQFIALDRVVRVPRLA